MTYDELEQRIGKPLKESLSTTVTDWTRFPQTLRRDSIREAERRLALDLNPAAIPDLVTSITLTLDAAFQANIETISVPALKKLFFKAGRIPIAIKPRSQEAKRSVLEWNNTPYYCYPISNGVFQFKYPDGRVYNASGYSPVLYYIKEPQTMRQFKPGYLLCGTSPTTVLGTWTAVTDGAFRTTIDGTAKSMTAINFSTALSMSGIASRIQTSLQAQSSGALVRWDAVNTRFKIISGGTSGITSVSVLTAGASGTDISGAGATPFMDGDVGATGESAVEGTAAFEFGNWSTELTGQENALILYATYYCLSKDGDEASAMAYMKAYLAEVTRTNQAYASENQEIL